LDGDKLVVVGDGTDGITLTTQLRKKLGFADLISVSLDEKKEENKEKVNKSKGETNNIQPLVYSYQYSYQYPYVCYEGAYDHYKL
jgi:threonine dehydrogenase-like Zn-dependent dehydrogenase